MTMQEGYRIQNLLGETESLVGWKIAATLTSVVFTIAFILFENISRYMVDSLGIHEFWTMLISYFGFLALIAWRARATSHRAAA